MNRIGNRFLIGIVVVLVLAAVLSAGKPVDGAREIAYLADGN